MVRTSKLTPDQWIWVFEQLEQRTKPDFAEVARLCKSELGVEISRQGIVQKWERYHALKYRKLKNNI